MRAKYRGAASTPALLHWPFDAVGRGFHRARRARRLRRHTQGPRLTISNRRCGARAVARPDTSGPAGGLALLEIQERPCVCARGQEAGHMHRRPGPGDVGIAFPPALELSLMRKLATKLERS